MVPDSWNTIYDLKRDSNPKNYERIAIFINVTHFAVVLVKLEHNVSVFKKQPNNIDLSHVTFAFHLHHNSINDH